MNRSLIRVAATAAAALVALAVAAPAGAATVVSRSGASALSLTVAGQGSDTGIVKASNDGSKETVTGQTSPPISVLKGQQLLDAGVLAQEATAKPGYSAACAGLAGAGGSVAQVGDSSCLTPGDEINASLGTLDLSKLVLADPSSPLGQLDAAQQALLPATSQLTAAINSGLDQVRSNVGDLGLVGNLGAVEGRCTAKDGDATGSATLTDVKVVGTAGGKTVTLLNLPVDPKPNTHLTTNLSDVLTIVLDAVDTDVTTSLDGALGPLTQVTQQIRDNIVKNIHDQVEKNLAPLEQNVLDVTLNRQERPSAGAIKVQALDLELLPVVQQQLGSSLVSLKIGNAACGPADALVSPPKAPQAGPKVPTSVAAGYASYPTSSGTNPVVYALIALAGLVVAGAAAVGFRRLG